DGVPIEGVTIQEIGPAAPRTFTSARGGWTSLEMAPSVSGWRFTAPGRAAVFRKATGPGAERAVEVQSPRLTQLAASGPTLFAAQSIPAPIPAGWSPLAAALSPGDAFNLELNEAVESGATAALARWDETTLTWRMVRMISGGAANVQINDGAGIFAVLRADSLPAAPASPVVGEPIQGVSTTVAFDSLSATASAAPALRVASRDPALVRT